VILTAHQPVYLPWSGLFHKIALADAFCYFDDVQYQKKDWNNRNRIKGPNGAFWLTVPVRGQDHFAIKLKDVEIVEQDVWRRKHWKSLRLCYGQAPFVARYADFFEETYRTAWQRLSDLNEHLLKFFLRELSITVRYYKMSELHFEGRKSDLVLDMCAKLGATGYIFGAEGRHYADAATFDAHGVHVYYQEYQHPTYPQQFGPFISHLSVVDLLFNCGPRSLEILMSGNVTREELQHRMRQNQHVG
jgi:hypothetical protein